MLVSQLLAGVVLLLFGRRLFWLFVAACGFAVGISLAPQLTTTPSQWRALLIALTLGVLGALLGLLFERLAIGVAGFLAGAYIAIRLLGVLGFQGPFAFWVAFVVGGLIGAVLLGMVFDWSLIGLSALAGSLLIADAAHLPPSGNRGLLLWLGLLVFGVVVQAAQMRGKARSVQP
jgi:hypothetical protein